MNANEIMDRYYLKMRAAVLELAASFDRLERGDDQKSVAGDERLRALRKAVEILLDNNPKRAQRVQMIFSDAYDPEWRGKFEKAWAGE